MKELTGHEFVKIRPKEFINPKTGYTLELDMYSSELHIASEYQGEQHFKFSKYFYGDNYSKFEYRLYKDEIKRQYCEQYNCPLLEIPYTANTDKKKIDLMVEFFRQHNIYYKIPDDIEYDDIYQDTISYEDEDSKEVNDEVTPAFNGLQI